MRTGIQWKVDKKVAGISCCSLRVDQLWWNQSLSLSLSFSLSPTITHYNDYTRIRRYPKALHFLLASYPASHALSLQLQAENTVTLADASDSSVSHKVHEIFGNRQTGRISTTYMLVSYYIVCFTTCWFHEPGLNLATCVSGKAICSIVKDMC